MKNNNTIKTQIFATPWIDLADQELLKLIASGVDSVRIHAGKLSYDRINYLIELYNRIKLKFYLDVTGNKARVINSQPQKFELDETVIIHTTSYINNTINQSLVLNFLPPVINQFEQGDLTIDDGRLIFAFEKNVIDESGKTVAVETRVVHNAQNIVFNGDGISSTTIPIHSFSSDPFSLDDIAMLQNIKIVNRKLIKYMIISFTENIEQLEKAKKIISDLGYTAKLVPKIETIEGVLNSQEICKWLNKQYSNDIPEITIGRGDLSLDLIRSGKINVEDLQNNVDYVVNNARKQGIFVSVLALIAQSLRTQMKNSISSSKLKLSKQEIKYIHNLLEIGVDQIGLTNETYVDEPWVIVQILRNQINQFSKK